MELTGLDLRYERDSKVCDDSPVSGLDDCKGVDAVRKSRGGIALGEDRASNMKPVDVRNPGGIQVGMSKGTQYRCLS